MSESQGDTTAGASRSERRRAFTAARRRRTALIVVGAVAVAVGVAVEASIGWFYLHSDSTGRKLTQQELRAIADAERAGSAHRSSSSHCAPPSDRSSTPQGLVEARTIGMKAPVVGGDSNTTLDVAVGHVPASAWPGQPGTSVLVAHDVTYFSNIGNLANGAIIDYVTPCATYSYRVTGHQIVTQGSPIYSNPSESILVLETCYPVDALYFTDQRYLVTASYLWTSRIGAAVPTVTAAASPTVPAPAALASQGLTLATNDAPLGTLSIGGAPASSWRQSSGPFDDEAAVLADYFAAMHAAAQGQSTWWAALAPAVPVSAAAPLQDASISKYDRALDITLTAHGATLTGASLAADISVAGGPAPGAYTLSVTIADTEGTLIVTGWSMTKI